MHMATGPKISDTDKKLKSIMEKWEEFQAFLDGLGMEIKTAIYYKDVDLMSPKEIVTANLIISQYLTSGYNFTAKPNPSK